MIVIGGILMITSAGDEGKVTTGKELISSALLGLITLFLLGAIITQLLGDATTAPPPATPTPASTSGDDSSQAELASTIDGLADGATGRSSPSPGKPPAECNEGVSWLKTIIPGAYADLTCFRHDDSISLLKQTDSR